MLPVRLRRGAGRSPHFPSSGAAGGNLVLSERKRDSILWQGVGVIVSWE